MQKPESTTIIKSLFISHAEKLTTLESNTIYLKQVINFFSCGNKSMSRCSSLDILNKQLEIYLEELSKTKRYLNNYIDLIDSKSISKNTVSHLIEYDKISQKITVFIEIFYKSISKKVFQIKEESFYDYIPRPIVGRMFSSKAFLDHIERSYNDLIHHFLKEKYHVVYFWDYVNNYTENALDKKNKEYFFNKEKFEETNFIQLAFWYHDAMNIPLITHEIGHMITTKEKTKENELFFVIKEKLNTRFKYETSKKNSNMSMIKGYEEKISEEIIADLFSLMCHKESYIVSLFHVLIGRNFSETFIKNNVSILNWEYKRDFSITRLWILMFIWDKFLEEEELESENKISKDKNAYIGLKGILDNLYNITPESHNGDLFEVYNTNYANLYDGYELISSTISKLIIITLNEIEDVLGNYDFRKNELDGSLLSSNYYENKLIEISDEYVNLGDLTIFHSLKLISETIFNKLKMKNNKYTPINNLKFGTLWKKRYTHARKEGELKITHNQYTFRKSMFESDKEFSKKLSIGKAYELKYYKIGRDNFHEILNHNENSVESIKSIINELNLESNKYSKKCNNLNASFLFDIYDYVTIQEELEEKKFIYEYKKQIESTLKFYTYNHSLVEIEFKDKKKISKEKTEDQFISILMHLQLFENNISSVSSICLQLQDLLDDEFRIYKSLGPKDLVLQVEYINLDKVFELKETIGSLSELRRTSTSIYLNDLYANGEILKKKEELEFYSVLRLKKNNTSNPPINWKDELKSDQLLKKNMNQIITSSGVTDVEIIWKYFSIETIDKLIKKLSDMSILSDIQNKVRKKEIIEYDIEYEI